MHDPNTPRPSRGEVFEEIRLQMVLVHWTWQAYRKLFADSKARFDLLAELLPDFGSLVYQVLLDSVLLGICRLCDKAGNGARSNLTFDRLQSSIDPPPDPQQTRWLRAKVLEIEAAVDVLRRHRDKRLAHLDLHCALSDTSPLPGISRQQIEDALRPMRELMNEVMDWHQLGEFNFYPHSPGDAESLIGYLQAAERLQELQDDYWFQRLSVNEIIAKLSDRHLPRL